MTTGQKFIILLMVIISSFHMPQLSLTSKGFFLSTLIFKTQKAYSKDLPKNRWQNDSPLSTFNPAVIPIQFSPQMRNNITMHNHMIVANQILSIYQLFRDWKGQFNPKNTNYALISSEIDLRYGRDNWRLSYIRRMELFLQASRGFVELTWYDKNKLPLPINRTFPLHLEGKGFEAHGVKFSYGKAFSYMGSKKIGYGLAMSLIKGIKTQKILLQGEAHVSSEKDYDYSGNLIYYYDDNYLYKREDIDIGNGNGITFDLGISMDITKRLAASLLLHDIWGMIWWQDVPFTDAHFDSHNKEYDENGYVKYNPSISGRESTADFTQKIISKTNLSLNYHINRWTVMISADFIEDEIYSNAYLGYYFSDSMVLNCGYSIYFNQIQIGARYRKFNLRISFDEIDPKKANALSLSVDFAFRF